MNHVYLAGVTCGLLTQQYLAIEQKATQSNGVVKKLHENVFCDVVSFRYQ